MDNVTESIRRATGVHDAIGDALTPLGGYLRCETCRDGHPMAPGEAGRYTAAGWPKCCGYTMRWWTRRQIDAGEMAS